MAKTKSTPSSVSEGASAATGTSSVPGQGAPGATITPAVPGAAAAVKTAESKSRTLTQREAERGDPPPVQNEANSEEGFMAWALAQAGVEDMELPDTPKSPPNREKTVKAKQVVEDEEDDLEVKGEDKQDDDAAAFDEEAPVLGDESEGDGETEDLEGEADGDEPSAKQDKLKKDNFKLREERRALRDELTARDKELDDLRAKVVQATAAGGEAALPAFGGYFSGVKTSAEVDNVVQRIESDLDFLEDNLDGYEFDDASGQTVVVSAAQAKAYRRMARESLRQATQVKTVLDTHTKRASESETLARKKYPFVFDSTHTRNALVLDLAKDHPALSRDPARALAFGRMAVGKLVESGEYVLVKRVKPKTNEQAGNLPKASERRATASPSASPSGAPARRTRESDAGLQDRILNGDADALTAAAMALIDD